jgi:hypothetical protein
MLLGYTMEKSLPQGDKNYLEPQSPRLLVPGEVNGYGLLSL